MNIEKLPLDTSNLNSNPWLAGFTDADGNFIISLEGSYGLNDSKIRGRVKCIFSITQRLIDPATGLSCLPFITDIANLFLSNVISDGPNAIRFLVQADSKWKMVKDYFFKYPLMSSKHLNFLDYLAGTKYLGIRLTNKQVKDIQDLKNSMNNKRIYYNWNHLKFFYEN